MNDANREVTRDTGWQPAGTEAPVASGERTASGSAGGTGLEPGQRVSEYILDELVGRGGFGEVWRGHHHVWRDRLVAVKVPLDREYVSKLRSEGILQHSVDSPHIVQTVGLDPEHDPPYLIMEWVEGESLRERIRREGRLAEAEALRIGREIAEALFEAHGKGIVHRDLKPENVLLDEEGRVRLTDFGLGKIYDAESASLMRSGSLRTREGADIVGTLRYMSPEQQDPKRARDVDHRTDLYALGIVLFEMLTGETPAGGEVPSEVRGGLDPRIDKIFRGCYSRLETRYGDVKHVLRDLDALEATEPVVEEPPPAVRERVRPLARPVRRRPLERMGLTPTGFFARLLATSLDLIVFGYAMFYLVRVFPLWWPVLFFLYEVSFLAVSGRTIGRWIVGARVVDYRTGRGIGAMQAVGRTILKIFSALPAFAGFALVAIDSEKRSFHDHVCGSAVVYGPSVPLELADEELAEDDLDG